MKILDVQQVNKDQIKNIIFDWGGVLINLDYKSVFEALEDIGINNPEELFTAGKANGLLSAYEQGKYTDQEFRDGIRALTKVALSDKQIDWAWMAILKDIPSQRIDTVKRLGEKYKVFLLSNTNSIHVDLYNKKMKEDHGVNNNDLFLKCFYSHQMKMSKPDPQIFVEVLNELGLDPNETLFIDDLEKNVDAAASVGLKSLYLNLSEGMDTAEVFKNW